MSACGLQLQGALIVGGAGGCGCSSGADTKVVNLALACAAAFFGAVASTECAQAVSTAGALGDNWVELPVSEAVGGIQFAYVKTTAPVMLRIGAAPAELAGASGAFPTGFVGGETFAFTVDGVAVATTFTSGAQSALQVATQINQAAVGAGLAFLPASVQTNGQLMLRGLKTGSQGSVDITTANATVGYPSASGFAEGEGQDIPVSGLFLNQFDQLTAPERIQISGVASVEVLLAGSAA
jgi:hypothetical protein